VKRHEHAPAAVVQLDLSREFGFLETDDGRAIYFYRNSVLDSAYSRLAVGSRVTFAEEVGEKRRKRRP
jgi:cold shock CspA family protein